MRTRTGSASFNMSPGESFGRHNLFKKSATSVVRTVRTGYQYWRYLKHACNNGVHRADLNSYKRLVNRGSMTGNVAPSFACYGGNNRTNMLRIPSAGGRIECRAADSATNPYLGCGDASRRRPGGRRTKCDPGEPHMENL